MDNLFINSPPQAQESNIEERVLTLETGHAHMLSLVQDIREQIEAIEIDFNTQKRNTEGNASLSNNETHDQFSLEHISRRIHYLESNQTQDRDDIDGIAAATKSIDSEINAIKTNVQDHSDRLSTIETKVLQLSMRQAELDFEVQELNETITDLALILTTIGNGLDEETHALQNLTAIGYAGSVTDCVSTENFTSTINNISAIIERGNIINEALESTLSQLEEDWNSLEDLVNNHTSRIAQAEKDVNTDQITIQRQVKKVTDLEANLTVVISDLEDKLMSDSYTLQNHSSELEDIVYKLTVEDSMILNNTLILNQLEKLLDTQNASLEVESSINQVQDSILTHLEMAVNDTRTTLESHELTLTRLTGK